MNAPIVPYTYTTAYAIHECLKHDFSIEALTFLKGEYRSHVISIIIDVIGMGLLVKWISIVNIRQK